MEWSHEEDMEEKEYAKMKEILNRRGIADILEKIEHIVKLRKDMDLIFDTMIEKDEQARDLIRSFKTKTDELFCAIDTATTKMLTQTRKEDK